MGVVDMREELPENAESVNVQQSFLVAHGSHPAQRLYLYGVLLPPSALRSLPLQATPQPYQFRCKPIPICICVLWGVYSMNTIFAILAMGGGTPTVSNPERDFNTSLFFIVVAVTVLVMRRRLKR